MNLKLNSGMCPGPGILGDYLIAHPFLVLSVRMVRPGANDEN